MKRKITIKKEYNNIRSFIKLLPGVMDSEGTYIYGGRRNLIKKFTAPDGTVVNVKRYKIPQGINKLVYSLGIRRPKGERAYEYATRLLQLGIPTPEAIAYIEQRHLGLLAESFLITRQCPYTHLLYEMGNASKEQYMPMACTAREYCTLISHPGIFFGTTTMTETSFSPLLTSTVCTLAP